MRRLSCGKTFGVRKIPAGDATLRFRRCRDFAKDICTNTCFTFADAACWRPVISTGHTGRHVTGETVIRQ
jgi:hypothetical protein